jgi:hypothetical protein
MTGRLGLAAVVVVGAFLVLFNLDQRILWSDEAETAQLARAILVHGFPIALPEHGWFYGPNMNWSNKEGYWTWTPWLDEYVAALSFLIFWPSDWSARLPFALIGIAAGAVTMRIAYRLTLSREMAIYAGILFFTSLPILYHIRQCRYYSIAIMANLWMIHGYLSLIQNRRWVGVLHLSLSLLTQFFTLTPMVIINFPALFITAMIDRSQRRSIPLEIVCSGVLTAVLGSIWLAWAQPLGQGKNFTLSHFLDNMLIYLRWMHAYVLPAIVAVLVIHLSRNGEPEQNDGVDGWMGRSVERIVLWATGLNMIVLSMMLMENTRYFVPMVAPVYLVFLRRLHSISFPCMVNVGLVLLVSLTSLLTYTPSLAEGHPARVGTYLQEWGSDYADPTSMVVSYLQSHSRSDDLVLTADEELAIAFETKLSVYRATTLEKPRFQTLGDLIEISKRNEKETFQIDDSYRPLPDWIIADSVGRTFGGRYELELPASWNSFYELIDIQVPDAPNSANDPDPMTRTFFRPAEQRLVRIYRRLEARESGSRDDEKGNR